MSNTAPAPDHGKKLKQLINIGKAELHWDDGFYRAMLADHGARLLDGQYSLRTMSVPQMEQLLEHMKRCGFRPRRRGGKGNVRRLSDWRQPLIGKIMKLWFRLHEEKVVKNPSKAAMAKWCSQHTGVAKLEWAEKQGLINCIEGLKSWCKREGVSID
jgi:phage gp16-like protein